MKQLLMFFALFLFFAPLAYAQKTTTPQLSVSPSIVRLDLSVDKPETVLTYTNLTNQNVLLSFEAQDFKELENGHQLSYLQEKDVNNYKYALSSWIKFSSNSLVLDSHQSGAVTVFIEKDKLSPGGHYATILATVNQENQNTKQVALRDVLGSLLFVRTNTGFEQENASLPSFDVVRNFFDFPDTVYFRFDNTGNTDLVPYGLVQITDWQNNLVAKGIVNQTSAPTLPESIRRYYVSLRTLQPFLFPGIYHAKINLHFGKTNKTLSKSFVFFSQGAVPFIPIILLVVTIFSFLFWRRRFKR